MNNIIKIRSNIAIFDNTDNKVHHMEFASYKQRHNNMQVFFKIFS